MLGDDELDAATHGDHDNLPSTVSTASRNFLHGQWGSMENAQAAQQQQQQQQAGGGKLFQQDPFGAAALPSGQTRQGRTPIDRDGFPMDLSNQKSVRTSNASGGGGGGSADAMEGVQKISENGGGAAENYDYDYGDVEMEYDGQSVVTDVDTVITEHTRDSLQVYEKKSKGVSRIARKGGAASQSNGDAGSVVSSSDKPAKGGSLGNFLDKQEKRKTSKSPVRDRPSASSPTREYTTGLKGANKTKVVSRGAAE
mmetsp:Transcript_52410/g.78304  ORF Transcript_52410/g.78304 Transcript_52410/m.78304 type:complete len:254 (-) Transcript_52410:336-1097(-)|eukprot:CAMPEP_0194035066 /NCGR_PEP_ID=MMETSP0009_2-20130614/7527_1 /TAXON_ID=210454 /ORGANISM="Grammatophora oceanica, Strain CCMP 410" /LENGTH=253 /DNA_ID=CAMNT_0038676281 /DNA_START=179 /DNA_END=940 /DNA_ORIENTATION=+